MRGPISVRAAIGEGIAVGLAVTGAHIEALSGGRRSNTKGPWYWPISWARIGHLGRRGAPCDAGTSVKRRNDPRGPIRPTEGRPQRPSRRPLWRHRAARLWCTTPRRETAP